MQLHHDIGHFTRDNSGENENTRVWYKGLGNSLKVEQNNDFSPELFEKFSTDRVGAEPTVISNNWIWKSDFRIL